MDNNEYNDLIIILKSQLKKRFLESVITPEDLISETYCQLGKEWEYNRKEFILKSCSFLTIIGRKIWSSKDHLPDQHRCFKCKQVLDSYHFGICKEREGGKRLSSYCKPCATINSMEWYNKKKMSPQGIQHLRNKSKKGKEKMIQNLPDHYIIQILSQKYPKEYLKQPENYHLIKERRKQIQQRRELCSKISNRTGKTYY